VVAVDVNAGHLAAAVLAADGNILGVPVTVPLDLAGQPAATRDGRLRAAISGLLALARAHGAHAIVIENLDFARARAEGREQSGSRPSRGRRGREFRRAVSAIPTGKLRDRLVQRLPPTWCKTATATRSPPPDQEAHDRSGPPAEQYLLPLSD
jgi:hypothetical protein